MTPEQSNQCRVLLTEMVTRAIPNLDGTHSIIISNELLNVVQDFLDKLRPDRIPASHPKASK